MSKKNSLTMTQTDLIERILAAMDMEDCNHKYNPVDKDSGVKHIARYLKGTQTKGVIMTPDSENMRIDMYADADFSGLYTTEDKMDPVSVKSRSGVLLTFGNVLILWSSKLQSKISLLLPFNQPPQRSLTT